MKIALIEGLLKIEINILIIDDDRDQAFNIDKVIKNYTSRFSDKEDFFGNKITITLKTLINGKNDITKDNFNGVQAYSASLIYLKENISTQDIIMCDHYIGSKANGHELLKEVAEIEKNNKVRSYKILHSSQNTYHNFLKESYIHYTATSKDNATLEQTLIFYETEIIKTMLFGNKEFYSYCYDSHSLFDYPQKLQLYSPVVYKNIELENILFAYSIGGKNNSFKFLKNGYTIEPDGATYVLSDFAESGLFFCVDNSFYVNKLWFSDYSIESNSIKFISLGNTPLVINLDDIRTNRIHKRKLINYLQRLFERKEKSQFFKPQLHPYFHL